MKSKLGSTALVLELDLGGDAVALLLLGDPGDEKYFLVRDPRDPLTFLGFNFSLEDSLDKAKAVAANSVLIVKEGLCCCCCCCTKDTSSSLGTKLGKLIVEVTVLSSSEGVWVIVKYLERVVLFVLVGNVLCSSDSSSSVSKYLKGRFRLKSLKVGSSLDTEVD